MSQIIRFPIAAGGADLSVGVVAGKTWIPKIFIALLTTGNVVGNRKVKLQILEDSGPTVVWESQNEFTQPASTAVRYCFGVGVDLPAPAAGALTVNLPLPKGLIVLPNWTIQTVTANLSAPLDIWSAAALVVDENAS